MPLVLKKKADAVLSELKKSDEMENAKKEHVLVSYDFNCKIGRRILRFEGTNEFGTDVYYDYNTKKTGSLESLAKHWGAVNLKTDKIDLEKGQTVKKEAQTQAEPAPQQAAPAVQPIKPPNEFMTDRQNETPSDSTNQQSGNERIRTPINQSTPPKKSAETPAPTTTRQEPAKTQQAPTKAQQEPATRRRPAQSQQQNPQGQAPRASTAQSGEDHASQGSQHQPRRSQPAQPSVPQKQAEKAKIPSPAPPQKMLDRLEAKLNYASILPGQNIPPAGAAVSDTQTTKYGYTYTILVDFQKLFRYYDYFPETIHCASFAIGAAFSAIAIHNGRCNTFMPVSSWELAAQMKIPEYSKMFKVVSPDIKSSADLIKFMADADNKLPIGTLLTLRAVGSAHTEIPANTPTHTLVYTGAGHWTDNITDVVPRRFSMRGDGNWKDYDKNIAKYFKYVENSGAYAPVFENFPKAAERRISLADFGLKSGTPENFALLISQTYHMPFEIVFNSIMNQHPSAKSRETSLDLSVKIFIPEIYVGKQMAGPINWANAPSKNKAPSSKVAVAGFSEAISGVYDKLKKISTNFRVDDFVAQCKEIDWLGPKVGVDAKDMDALKVILFNEYYSSSGLASGRLLEKKTIAHLPVFGGIDLLNSYGVFQYNINAALNFLSDKKDREAFIALFRGSLGRLNAKQTQTLGNFDALSKDEKRDFIAKELLTDVGIGLFFANKLYQQNKSIVADNAKRHIGQGESAYDLELTSVFSYNRGSESTNSAIFQQNLLITAENMLGQARFSKYHDQLQAAIKGYKIDGGVAVEGKNGKYSPSKTFKLFKIVCEANGIAEISANGKKYPVQSMTPGDFVAVFGKNYSTVGAGGKKAFINNYQKMAEFFALPQFAQPEMKAAPAKAAPVSKAQADYLESFRSPYPPGSLFFDDSNTTPPFPFMLGKASADAKPAEDKPPVPIKPCLDFGYLRARPAYITSYVSNYIAFMPASK